MNSLETHSYERKTIKSGEIIFKEGDQPENLFLLQSGKVLCFKSNEERVIPISTVEMNGVIGEDCIFSDSRNYHYFAIAMDESVIVVIPKTDIYQVLSQCSDWAGDVMKDISRKMQHTSELISEHKLVDASLTSGLDLTEDEIALIKGGLS